MTAQAKSILLGSVVCFDWPTALLRVKPDPAQRDRHERVNSSTWGTDGRTDRRADGRTGGLMDGRTVCLTACLSICRLVIWASREFHNNRCRCSCCCCCYYYYCCSCCCCILQVVNLLNNTKIFTTAAISAAGQLLN